jgi:hypothetical protein
VIFDLESKGFSPPHVNTFDSARSQGFDVELNTERPVTATAYALIIRFERLPAEEEMAFQIDLDDTSHISARGRQRVTFGELASSQVTASLKRQTGYPAYSEAAFNQMGLVESSAAGCP